MPNNYQFIDAYGSVLTARSSITSGVIQEPIVQISSFLTAIPIQITGNQSVSGTIGASIFGQLPAGTALLGSIITLLYDSAGTGLTTTGVGLNVNIARITAATDSILSKSGQRNDAVASFLGGDLTRNFLGTDSAGRILIKPFSAEESRIEGYSSTVNTSQTTLVAAAGAGLRNYITDLFFANTGAATTLVTFKDGAGSILGYTIAPTAGGSNLPGLQVPIRTGANATFDFQAATGTSVLYATVKGFKAP